MHARPLNTIGLFLVGPALAMAWKLQVLTLALLLGLVLAAVGLAGNIVARRTDEKTRQ